MSIVFILIPTGVGFALGNHVVLWLGFITASAPVFSVLTGFSINIIVLLMWYRSNGSHPYGDRTVKKEFTLYSILLGVVLIICLVFGLILSRIDGTIGAEIAFVAGGTVYSLMAHYFLTLLIVTHRLWSLVHRDVM
ncbi:MAG: hypothetical protein J07HX64_00106 [halophilic archaeon J07HX64]|nr:MAG: hypothetical protein J07HX64_00106 [halophilic archaeon J07HX64]